MGPAKRTARDVAGIALVVAAALAVALPTPLRPALLRLEPLLAPGLFLLALGLGIASVGGRRARRAALRLERALGGALRLAGIPAAMLAFLLPMFAAWDLQPSGAASASAALVGRLPHLDAHGHLEGATRLLAAGEINDFSARRPLHACWLAVRLGVLGSLPWALAAQAALLGASVGAAARLVAARYGVATMLAFAAVMQGLLRDYAAAVLTEPLAASLATVGCALLAASSSRPWLGIAAAGLLLVDMALHARPGAQLLAPALALWTVHAFPGRRRAAAAAAAGCLAASAILTASLNALYAPPGASVSSYPAYTAYGLVSGSNYRAALDAHAAALSRLPDERARARHLYRAAAERFAADPGVLAATLAANLQEFLRKLVPNLGRVVDPAMLAVGPRDQVLLPGHLRVTHLALGLPILLLCAAGFVLRLRRVPAAERRLWGAALVALLGSAAVVYGDAGFRGLAPAYPVVALLLAMGVTPRRGVAAADPLPLARAAVAGAAMLAAAAVVGPALLGPTGPAPEELPAAPSHGVAHAIRIDGTSPHVVVWNTPPPHLAEAVTRRQFYRAAELGGARYLDVLERLDTPLVLVSAFDYRSRRQVVIAARPSLLEARGTLLDVRGQADGAITRADAWAAVDSR